MRVQNKNAGARRVLGSQLGRTTGVKTNAREINGLALDRHVISLYFVQSRKGTQRGPKSVSKFIQKTTLITESKVKQRTGWQMLLGKLQIYVRKRLYQPDVHRTTKCSKGLYSWTFCDKRSSHSQGRDAAQVCETYQEPPIRLRRNKGPGASCALDNNNR